MWKPRRGCSRKELDSKCLKALARALPAVEAHVLSIPAHLHHPKREVLMQMGFQKVQVQPPIHKTFLRQTEITAWVVQV